LERIGGEDVDHAVGNIFSPQIVSVAHRVAQILRAACNNDRLAGSNDARKSPVKLHVRGHIVGLVGHHAVQVNVARTFVRRRRGDVPGRTS